MNIKNLSIGILSLLLVINMSFSPSLFGTETLDSENTSGSGVTSNEANSEQPTISKPKPRPRGSTDDVIDTSDLSSPADTPNYTFYIDTAHNSEKVFTLKPGANVRVIGVRDGVRIDTPENANDLGEAGIMRITLDNVRMQKDGYGTAYKGSINVSTNSSVIINCEGTNKIEVQANDNNGIGSPIQIHENSNVTVSGIGEHLLNLIAGKRGAAIGSGGSATPGNTGAYMPTAGSVYIKNLNLSATSIQSGAVIGAGYKWSMTDIIIEDSTITCASFTGTDANEGIDSAGATIGGGRDRASCNDIIIKNSTIYSDGARGSLIGAGRTNSNCHDIIIYDSYVSLKKDTAGSGIGGGRNQSSVSSIKISNSSIVARSNFDGSSAFIGKGGDNEDSVDNITIYSGYIDSSFNNGTPSNSRGILSLNAPKILGGYINVSCVNNHWDYQTYPRPVGEETTPVYKYVIHLDGGATNTSFASISGVIIEHAPYYNLSNAKTDKDGNIICYLPATSVTKKIQMNIDEIIYITTKAIVNTTPRITTSQTLPFSEATSGAILKKMIYKSEGDTIDLRDDDPIERGETDADGILWTYDDTTKIYTIQNGKAVRVIGTNANTDVRVITETDGNLLDESGIIKVTFESISAEGGTAENEAPFLVGANSSAIITTVGNNSLTGQNSAGLQVAPNANITITGISESSLTAKSLTYGAAIGAGTLDGGNIHIKNISITAISIFGAGIGAGFGMIGRSSIGLIMIETSTINVENTALGAAIGGGLLDAPAQDIIIDNSTIKAVSSNGAGIGGGPESSAGNILIKNSEVDITAGVGAGIGAGNAGQNTPRPANCGDIDIVASIVKCGSFGQDADYGAASDLGSGAVYLSGSLSATANANAGQIRIHSGMVILPDTGGHVGTISGSSVIISGGSIKASRIVPQPTTGDFNQVTSTYTTKVYRNDITLQAPSGILDNQEINFFYIPNASYYDINKIKTDDIGKMYLWYPSCASPGQTLRATVSGMELITHDAITKSNPSDNDNKFVLLRNGSYSSGDLIDLSDTFPIAEGRNASNDLLWTYDSVTKVYEVKDGASVRIINSNKDTTARVVTENDSSDVKITMQDVSASGLNTDGDAPLIISANSQTKIILAGDNYLRGFNSAGLGGESSSVITIEGTTGSSLVAESIIKGAAIGAGTTNGGTIQIKSASITAIANEGAGIGGGAENAPAEETTIEDSTVYAKSNNGGAGIGGGVSDSLCVAIIIKNSSIVAQANEGAGIGAGKAASKNEYIEIYTSTITASSLFGAGLGAGKDYSPCNGISMENSTISAIGRFGAGIGAGNNSHVANITISNSVVDSNSVGNGAGIGAGVDGDCDDISFDSSIIICTGSGLSYDIGSAEEGEASSLTIESGMVQAKEHGISTPQTTILGGSINASSITPTPKNGSANGNEFVYKTTIKILDRPVTAITSFTIPNASYYDATTKVKTDESGKLYFWYPETSGTGQTLTAEVQGSINTLTTTGAITKNDNTSLIIMKREGPISVGEVINLGDTTPELEGRVDAQQSGALLWTYNYSTKIYTIQTGASVAVTGTNKDTGATIATAKNGNDSADGEGEIVIVLVGAQFVRNNENASLDAPVNIDENNTVEIGIAGEGNSIDTMMPTGILVNKSNVKILGYPDAADIALITISALTVGIGSVGKDIGKIEIKDVDLGVVGGEAGISAVNTIWDADHSKPKAQRLGDIVIDSATVTAIAEGYWSAIGGGVTDKKIIIRNSTVEAISCSNSSVDPANTHGAGSAIGGDHSGTGGDIIIENSFVSAHAVRNGAAIGSATAESGFTSQGNDINISNSDVHVQSYKGAGIGGGAYRESFIDEIRIESSKITGTCLNGSVIGGGVHGGDVGEINIIDSSVDGNVSEGAIVGGGYDISEAGDIMISSSTVSGVALENGAVIGGGVYKCKVGNIKIEKSNVYAEVYNSGSAIGDGAYGKDPSFTGVGNSQSGNIEIIYSTVTGKRLVAGSVIGGVNNTDSNNITISSSAIYTECSQGAYNIGGAVSNITIKSGTIINKGASSINATQNVIILGGSIATDNIVPRPKNGSANGNKEVYKNKIYIKGVETTFANQKIDNFYLSGSGLGYYDTTDWVYADEDSNVYYWYPKTTPNTVDFIATMAGFKYPLITNGAVTVDNDTTNNFVIERYGTYSFAEVIDLSDIQPVLEGRVGGNEAGDLLWTYDAVASVYAVNFNASVRIINSNENTGARVVATGTHAGLIKMTIEGISATGGALENEAPISIGISTNLYLTTVGDNYLTGVHSAGLQVNTDGELTIFGTSGSSLTAKSLEEGAGIGGGVEDATSDRIKNISIINASVTAIAKNGAGIGGGKDTPVWDIVLSNSSISASSENYSDIGDGFVDIIGHSMRVTIHSGMVTAMNSGIYVVGGITIRGGSIKTNSMSPRPKNQGGADVYKSVITIQSRPNTKVESMTIEDATYYDGVSSVWTDEDAKLYYWLPVTAGPEMTSLTGGIEYSTDSAIVSGNDNNNILLAAVITKSIAEIIVLSDDDPATEGRTAGDANGDLLWTYNPATKVYTVETGVTVRIIGSNEDTSARVTTKANGNSQGNAGIIRMSIENVSARGNNMNNEAPILIGNNSSVILKTIGNNELVGINSAGLQTTQNSNITITGITGSSLVAKSEGAGAGIGAGVNMPAGNIYIVSASVSAIAKQGACIGGGYSQASCGKIRIEKSTVSAVTDFYSGHGAGIGGGESNSQCLDIEVSNSTVKTVANAAAGIGGGNLFSPVENISIINSTIESNAGCAGIGGGNMSSCGNIIVKASKVEAYGSMGAGIGSGYESIFDSIDLIASIITVSGVYSDLGKVYDPFDEGNNNYTQIRIHSGMIITMNTHVIESHNVIISGGSINANRITVRPTNGMGVPVYKNTMIITGRPNSKIEGCSIPEAPYYDGTTEVWTDGEAKLYYWYPQSEGQTIVITTGGISFEEDDVVTEDDDDNGITLESDDEKSFAEIIDLSDQNPVLEGRVDGDPAGDLLWTYEPTTKIYTVKLGKKVKVIGSNENTGVRVTTEEDGNNDLTELIEITIESISATGGALENEAPIIVGTNTSIVMYVVGSNNLVGIKSAGLQLAPSGQVIIFGDEGSQLTARSTEEGAGIGAGTNMGGGYIFIHAVSITAIAENGAGIGGGNNAGVLDIEISASNITAQSENGSDIGQGAPVTVGNVGSVTIRSGMITAITQGIMASSVYILGGSIKATTITPRPTNGGDNGDQSVYKNTFTIGSRKNAKVDAFNIPNYSYYDATTSVWTDNEAKVYYWYPVSSSQDLTAISRGIEYMTEGAVTASNDNNNYVLTVSPNNNQTMSRIINLNTVFKASSPNMGSHWSVDKVLRILYIDNKADIEIIGNNTQVRFDIDRDSKVKIKLNGINVTSYAYDNLFTIGSKSMADFIIAGTVEFNSSLNVFDVDKTSYLTLTGEGSANVSADQCSSFVSGGKDVKIDKLSIEVNTSTQKNIIDVYGEFRAEDSHLSLINMNVSQTNCIEASEVWLVRSIVNISTKMNAIGGERTSEVYVFASRINISSPDDQLGYGILAKEQIYVDSGNIEIMRDEGIDVKAKKITILGGNVNINKPSQRTKTSEGENLYRAICNLPVTNVLINNIRIEGGYKYNSDGTKVDELGRVYLYLPLNVQAVEVVFETEAGDFGGQLITNLGAENNTFGFDRLIDFSVTQNGGVLNSKDTTSLTLEFTHPVSVLTTDNVLLDSLEGSADVTGVRMIPDKEGELSGLTWEVIVSNVSGGAVDVKLYNLSGYYLLSNQESHEVELLSKIIVSFKLTQVGGKSKKKNTASITITFTKPVTGLKSASVLIKNNTGKATKKSVSGKGTKYTIKLKKVTKEGYIIISLKAFGVYKFANNDIKIKVFKKK